MGKFHAWLGLIFFVSAGLWAQSPDCTSLFSENEIENARRLGAIQGYLDPAKKTTEWEPAVDAFLSLASAKPTERYLHVGTEVKDLQAELDKIWRTAPNGFRAFVQARNGQFASAALDDAVRANYNLPALLKVIEDYPFTKAGMEAQVLFATLSLERGQYALADSYLSRHISQNDFAESPLGGVTSRTWFKAAVARARNQEPDEAGEFLTGLKRSLSNQPLAIGRKTYSFEQLEAETRRPVTSVDDKIARISEVALGQQIAEACHPDPEIADTARAGLEKWGVAFCREAAAFTEPYAKALKQLTCPESTCFDSPRHFTHHVATTPEGGLVTAYQSTIQIFEPGKTDPAMGQQLGLRERVVGIGVDGARVISINTGTQHLSLFRRDGNKKMTLVTLPRELAGKRIGWASLVGTSQLVVRTNDASLAHDMLLYDLRTKKVVWTRKFSEPKLLTERRTTEVFQLPPPETAILTTTYRADLRQHQIGLIDLKTGEEKKLIRIAESEFPFLGVLEPIQYDSVGGSFIVREHDLNIEGAEKHPGYWLQAAGKPVLPGVRFDARQIHPSGEYAIGKIGGKDVIATKDGKVYPLDAPPGGAYQLVYGFTREGKSMITAYRQGNMKSRLCLTPFHLAAATKPVEWERRAKGSILVAAPLAPTTPGSGAAATHR